MRTGRGHKPNVAKQITRTLKVCGHQSQKGRLVNGTAFLGERSGVNGEILALGQRAGSPRLRPLTTHLSPVLPHLLHHQKLEVIGVATTSTGYGDVGHSSSHSPKALPI